MRAFMSRLRIEVKGHLTQSLVVEPQFCQRIQQFPLEKSFQNLCNMAFIRCVFGISMASQSRIQAVPDAESDLWQNVSLYIAYSLSQHLLVCENHDKALSCIRPTLERRPPLKWVDSEYSRILQGGDHRPEHFKWMERSGSRIFTIKHSWNDFVFEHLTGVLILNTWDISLNGCFIVKTN